MSEKKRECTGSPGSLSLGLFPKCFGLNYQQWFFNMSCYFPSLTFSKITQWPKCYQAISKKNQYAAYLHESCSIILITATMKPMLQGPSEMAYSQDQYVYTHYKSAGMKFYFKSIKCLLVQALGSCTHFKYSV